MKAERCQHGDIKGWKADFKAGPRTTMLDNLLKKSDNMAWWNRDDVVVGKETIHVDTLHDVFNNFLGRIAQPMSAIMNDGC